MASNFFDTMFSSQFKESTDSKIALPTTNAKTFEEVVQFIYTGNVCVTSSNFNRLLEASEFFELPGISDLCTKFIETHKIGVQRTLSAFSFARKTSKQILIDRLSKDIVEHFRIFSRADEFLEIPIEGLQTVLNQCSSPETEEVKVGAIGRWVSHDQEGRIQHVYDLAEMIRFGNVTDEFIRSVFAKFWVEPHNTRSFTENLKPIGFDDITEISRRGTEWEEKLLRVYVRSTEGDDSMRIFSVNNGGTCTITPAKNLLNSGSNQWIRNVSLDNHLYRLDYCRRGANAEPSYQAFSIHTLADMMGPSLCLMPPPLIFGDVSFCTIRNNIYAYHKTLFRQLMRISCNNLTPFDDEEINRGVYIYNCELDNWFPVPAMKKRLEDSCMVSWNDRILYLIDGADNEGKCVNYVQGYDCRMGTWQELPKSNRTTNFAAGDCCVHNGKIYVCGGGHGYCEIFDPTACKWATLSRGWQMGSPMKYHKVIFHSNKLWAIGSLLGGVYKDNLSSVQFRATASQAWSSSDVLERAPINSTTGIIVDVVIF